MTALGLLALLLTLAAVFGFINYRWLRLPSSTGVLIIALVVSLALIAVDRLMPGNGLRGELQRLLGVLDLPATLLNGALSFLLFAGSLHVDLRHLRSRKWTVLALATIGVLLSVLFFSAGMWLVFHLLGHTVPVVWCVLLGAILAPTDPVAVVGMLKRLGLPPGLQATFAGESLFNDGVGVVVFGMALGVATGAAGPLTGVAIATTFLTEAVGGAALGLAAGWVALLMMRRVDEYNLELTVSLALATGAYSLAGLLGMSGPIAVVVAGLTIGSETGRRAMSDITHRHLMTFWPLVDELLNVLLFLLIGFEVIVVPFGWLDLAAAGIAIPLALLVRAASVFLPTILLNLHTPNKLGALAVLTWGGLRGGISVALALTLPRDGPRAQLLTVCYAVVVFTIVAQGLTMQRVVRRFYKNLPEGEGSSAPSPSGQSNRI